MFTARRLRTGLLCTLVVGAVVLLVGMRAFPAYNPTSRPSPSAARSVDPRVRLQASPCQAAEDFQAYGFPQRARGASEDGVDRYARDQFFLGSTSGRYVEVGAGSGDPRFSSTLALEEQGWWGLLVEASATAVQDLRRARPLATITHATVCDSTAPVHFVDRDGPGSSREDGEAAGCGMAGTGIVEFMPDLFLKSWHPYIAHNHSWLSGDSHQTTCESLTSVLDEAGILHANLMTIDVVSVRGLGRGRPCTSVLASFDVVVWSRFKFVPAASHCHRAVSVWIAWLCDLCRYNNVYDQEGAELSAMGASCAPCGSLRAGFMAPSAAARSGGSRRQHCTRPGATWRRLRLCGLGRRWPCLRSPGRSSGTSWSGPCTTWPWVWTPSTSTTTRTCRRTT
jgi:hypothetical protein